MIVSFAPFMNTIRAAKGAMTLLLFVYGVGFSSFLASAQAYTAAIVSQQKTGEPPSTRTGAFADIPDFPSKILGNSRSITVYLPPSYASEKSRRYPVLYAQDGQNLFDRRTAFLGREWELDETLERRIKDGMLPEIIVVGVWNTPARMEEYTPGAGGDRYVRFLVEELKPTIDRRFRTRHDARNTAILGSSMGGLISTWAALRRPDVFGQAASLSSVFQFMGEATTRLLSQIFDSKKKPPVRLYFDFGTKEVDEKPERYVAYLGGMEEQLEKAGFRWGTDYVTYVVPGAEHNETWWAKRVWRPLSFLFPSK